MEAGKTKDQLSELRDFDLVNHFLRKLKKGTRNFCLVHPQRWGYNVDTEPKPLIGKREMVYQYM